jgi:hypothetical protein
VRFEQPAGEAAAAPEAVRPSAPEEFRVSQSDIPGRGCSGACAQCTRIGYYGRGWPGGRHANACRTRILGAISTSDVGKRRIADYDERLGRAMVEFPNPDQAEAAGSPAPRVERAEGATRQALGGEGQACTDRNVGGTWRREPLHDDEATPWPRASHTLVHPAGGETTGCREAPGPDGV